MKVYTAPGLLCNHGDWYQFLTTRQQVRFRAGQRSFTQDLPLSPIVHVFQGVAAVAAVSLAIGYPTVVSAPHLIINAFRNLLAVAAVTDITFKEAESVSNVCVRVCVCVLHS